MIRNLIVDTKAQVSAEFLVVLAAVLAVALVLVGSLRDVTGGAEKTASSNADKTVKEIKGIKPK